MLKLCTQMLNTTTAIRVNGLGSCLAEEWGYMRLSQPLCKLLLSLPAIALLKDKDPGAFLIRDSHSFQGAYGLALKVATPPPSAQPWKGTGCPDLREKGSGVGQGQRQNEEGGGRLSHLVGRNRK